MKLTVEIEADEQDICDAIIGIPVHFLQSYNPKSPVQLIARALKEAYEKHGERAEVLKEIERRMRSNGIFYQDIWDRVLQTRTSVLRDCLNANFEKTVLAMKKENRR